MLEEEISELKKMLKESLSIGFIYTIAELIAGGFLISLEKDLLIIPGLAVMLPGVLDQRGSISSTLASRLGSALHMGWMKPEIALKGEAWENIVGSLILSIIMGVVVAILASIICWILGLNANPLTLITISVLAGLLATLVILPIALIVSVKAFQKGWDPNNISAPILATLGDITMIASLLVVVKILKLVGLV